MLYFHDLQPTPEGTEVATVPPELRTEMDRRYWLFMTASVPFPPIDVAAFVVKGPQRVDRYALLVRADHLDGTPDENVASIRRTSPSGWDVRARTGSL